MLRLRCRAQSPTKLPQAPAQRLEHLRLDKLHLDAILLLAHRIDNGESQALDAVFDHKFTREHGRCPRGRGQLKSLRDRQAEAACAPCGERSLARYHRETLGLCKLRLDQQRQDHAQTILASGRNGHICHDNP